MNRPPPLLRILFRLRIVRLSRRWADWVEEDVGAPRFVFWSIVSTLFWWSLVTTAITAVWHEFPTVFVVAFLCVQWGPLLVPRGRRWLRDRDLAWQRRKWERQTSA